MNLLTEPEELKKRLLRVSKVPGLSEKANDALMETHKVAVEAIKSYETVLNEQLSVEGAGCFCADRAQKALYEQEKEGKE